MAHDEQEFENQPDVRASLNGRGNGFGAGLDTKPASAGEDQDVTTEEIGRSPQKAAAGTQEIARTATEVAAIADATRQSMDDTSRSAEELSRMAGDLASLADEYH